MKIATWNVERLKHKTHINEITAACNATKADILVLTETDERIAPNYTLCFKTPVPINQNRAKFASTESRVAIYTNYRCVFQHPTFDKYTAICVELETDRGNLLVYGTVIGVFGNRNATFLPDLEKQMSDVRRFSSISNALCVCGDFNCSFGDNYYYTKDGRAAILSAFSENDVRIVTADEKECVDHIALTSSFIGDRDVHIEQLNQAKTLSDHKGIAVTF